MRRVLVGKARVGAIELGEAESHHLRDVLRLLPGAEVEVFDREGTTGQGVVVSTNGRRVTVEVARILEGSRDRFALTIASAIPKGSRADWMVEKLSELGVHRFIPLATDRSVVVPGGAGKISRWNRLTTEAARQSGRAGVMEIGEVTALAEVLNIAKGGIAYLSLEEYAKPARELAAGILGNMTVLVGPEGGWSEGELARFRAAKIPAYRLTGTVLRLETAAIAVAAIIECSRMVLEGS
jgi:16S rRNA (uracil1498-N3)-methyltransferase